MIHTHNTHTHTHTPLQKVDRRESCFRNQEREKPGMRAGMAGWSHGGVGTRLHVVGFIFLAD